jgi:hypothetical protein
MSNNGTTNHCTATAPCSARSSLRLSQRVNSVVLLQGDKPLEGWIYFDRISFTGALTLSKAVPNRECDVA